MDNNFNSTMEALFKGMDGFVTSKTVVGDKIEFADGTVIVPMVDVSFGAGAGAFASENSKKKNNGVGALQGKISPSSVLVIRNGEVRLVNVKSQDTLTKILDMAPDLTTRFGAMFKKGGTAPAEAPAMTEADVAETLENGETPAE